MIGEEVIAVYGDAGDGKELFEVQKLVRCKECKHRNERCGMGEHRWCEMLNMSTTPNDYCSYGEREDE